METCNRCGSSMSLWCDGDIKQLKEDRAKFQIENQSLRSDVKLWQKRVDEAAKVVETFEELQVENKRLKKQISKMKDQADTMGTSYRHPLDMD